MAPTNKKGHPKSCIRSGAPFGPFSVRSRQGSGRVPGKDQNGQGGWGHLNLDTLFTNFAEASVWPPGPAAAAAPRSFLSTWMASPPLSLTCKRSPFLLTEHQAWEGQPWPYGPMAPRHSEDTQTQKAKRQRFSGCPGPGPSLRWKSWVCSCQTRYLLKSWAGPAGLRNFQDL